MEGWAKEDARYVVSLATEGQLGFTCNARNLELIIRRMRQAPLAEVRELGRQLFAKAHEIAPSLIILADEEGFKKAYGAGLEEAYFEHAASDLANAVADVQVPATLEHAAERMSGDVTLIDHTPEPDVAVISALLFAAGRGALGPCLQAARNMSQEHRVSLVARTLTHMSQFDAPPRAFEDAIFRFELVIDASALAQLKRHRMSTQHWGPYDPELGVTIPPMVDAIGQRAGFPLVDGSHRRHLACTANVLDRPGGGGSGLRADQRPSTTGGGHHEFAGAVPLLSSARGSARAMGDPKDRSGHLETRATCRTCDVDTAGWQGSLRRSSAAGFTRDDVRYGPRFMKPLPRWLTFGILPVIVFCDAFSWYATYSLISLHLHDMGMTVQEIGTLHATLRWATLGATLIGGIVAIGVGPWVILGVGALFAAVGLGLVSVSADALTVGLALTAIGHGLMRPGVWGAAARAFSGSLEQMRNGLAALLWGSTNFAALMGPLAWLLAGPLASTSPWSPSSARCSFRSPSPSQQSVAA